MHHVSNLWCFNAIVTVLSCWFPAVRDFNFQVNASILYHWFTEPGANLWKTFTKLQKKGLMSSVEAPSSLKHTDRRKGGGGYIMGAFFCCVSDFTKAGYSFELCELSGPQWAGWWRAAYHRTFPNCHPADSSQPRERGREAVTRGRHKSYVLYKKKYYPCQGKVGCPKMNDNRLIKNNGRLNDK